MQETFFDKIKSLRYSLFVVVLFFLGVGLHTSGIFYSGTVEEMEASYSWTPIIIPIILAVIGFLVYRFKLLGTN